MKKPKKEAKRRGEGALPTRMFGSNDQCSGVLGKHFGIDEGKAASKRNLLLLFCIK